MSLFTSVSCLCAIWLAAVRSGRGRLAASVSPPPPERVKGQPEPLKSCLLPIKRDFLRPPWVDLVLDYTGSNFANLKESENKLSLNLDHCCMRSCRAYKVNNYPRYCIALRSDVHVNCYVTCHYSTNLIIGLSRLRRIDQGYAPARAQRGTAFPSAKL